MKKIRLPAAQIQEWADRHDIRVSNITDLRAMVEDARSMTVVRRFVHKRGFMDGTKYIEYRDGKMFIVNKKGEAHETPHYSLECALDHVDHGSWKEIPL